jgi:hypothetical protein
MDTTAIAGTAITGRTIVMDINIMATIAGSGITGGRTMDADTTPGLVTTGPTMDAGTTSGLATRSGCITTAAAVERERSDGDTGRPDGDRNCGALWVLPDATEKSSDQSEVVCDSIRTVRSHVCERRKFPEGQRWQSVLRKFQ